MVTTVTYRELWLRGELAVGESRDRSPDETGYFPVEFVERVRVLAGHLEVKGGRERRLVDCLFVRPSLRSCLGEDSLAVSRRLGIPWAWEFRRKAELTGQRRRRGEEPCFEFAVREDHGDLLVFPDALSSGLQERTAGGWAIVVGVQQDEHAALAWNPKRGRLNRPLDSASDRDLSSGNPHRRWRQQIRHAEFDGEPVQKLGQRGHFTVALDDRGDGGRSPCITHVRGSVSSEIRGESWLPRMSSPKV